MTRSSPFRRACAIAAALACVVFGAVAPVVGLDGKVKKLTPKEVLDMRSAGEEVVFLDTRRSPSGYTIPGSVHVPASRVEEWAASADRDALVVAYCT